MDWTDPMGLAEWKGAYAEGSLGVKAFGVKVVNFLLKSECNKSTNKKYIVKVLARGFNLSLDLSLLGIYRCWYYNS